MSSPATENVYDVIVIGTGPIGQTVAVADAPVTGIDAAKDLSGFTSRRGPGCS
jgi:pyruvate/2-oxoglutarate dehydrogenase complex dihydrolipoamide dehydrogenase (E3) component